MFVLSHLTHPKRRPSATRYLSLNVLYLANHHIFIAHPRARDQTPHITTHKYKPKNPKISVSSIVKVGKSCAPITSKTPCQTDRPPTPPAVPLYQFPYLRELVEIVMEKTVMSLCLSSIKKIRTS